ncbi:MAG TPA: BON domain-containing protein [Candidatus Angelobacter sp.]|nr:BON domain-containing protein [Candidatus Angelobacter sp.]
MIASALRLISRFAAGLRISMVLALLIATASFTLWGQPVPQFPRSSTPPVTNDNAPNTKEHHDRMSTKDVQEKLQKGLDNKNAAYAGSDIKVAANDQSVTLKGTVTSSTQHEMAMQLARAYAGSRKIVDQLTIR